MTPFIAVKGRGKAANVNAFPNASLVPVGFAREDAYVVSAEVVVSISCMLHNC